MKKSKIIYLILIIVIYTIVNNNSSELINVNRKNYKGQKYLRASESLIALSNSRTQYFDESDKTNMYPFVNGEIDNSQALIEYRFVNPSSANYVYFNCKSEDKSSCEIWRIIGVFNVENENQNYEYRIKLIRDESIGKIAFDENNADFGLSSLKDYLNNDYYNSLSETSKKLIVQTKFYTGGKDIESNNATTFYNEERSNNTKEYVGNVGLMYPSDYLYSFYKVERSCTNDLESCTKSDTSWISDILKSKVWTITPIVGTNQIYTINYKNIKKAPINESMEVYPVVYIKFDSILSSGTGTYTDPYEIRSLNNSEIQKESEMNTNGLSKDSVLVDDTLSNKSIVIIIISAVLILSGGFLIIKLYINKKKIK